MDSNDSGAQKDNRTSIWGEKVRDVPEWNGLFELYKNENGEHSILLSSALSHRFQALSWGLDSSELSLASALAFLAQSDDIDPSSIIKVPPPRISVLSTNIVELYRAAKGVESIAWISTIILRTLRLHLGNDIKSICGTTEMREKQAKEITRKFGRALDSLVKAGHAKHHASSRTVAVIMPDGGTEQKPVAWVAIQTCLDFVAMNYRLPTKGELRKLIVAKYPEIKEQHQAAMQKGDAFWAKVWKQAGLQVLPRDRAHTFNNKE